MSSNPAAVNIEFIRNFNDETAFSSRRAVPAGNGKLTPELFENAGVVVDEPVVTPAAPFGQNIRSKSFFEKAISAEWRKNVTSIVQTGAFLLEAEEELDRDVFRALKIPFAVRVSQMLRRIARHPILRDPAYHGSLPACWRTLYALAEMDDHALLRAALVDGRIHPGLPRKDIRGALGLPPKLPRGARKGDDQPEAPPDPITVWAEFSGEQKRKILDHEGRVGLAAIVSPALLADLVDHMTGKELSATAATGSTGRLAVTLTRSLRAALSIISDTQTGTAIADMRRKLAGNNRTLDDVGIVLIDAKKRNRKGRG